MDGGLPEAGFRLLARHEGVQILRHQVVSAVQIDQTCQTTLSTSNRSSITMWSLGHIMDTKLLISTVEIPTGKAGAAAWGKGVLDQTAGIRVTLQAVPPV